MTGTGRRPVNAATSLKVPEVASHSRCASRDFNTHHRLYGTPVRQARSMLRCRTAVPRQAGPPCLSSLWLRCGSTARRRGRVRELRVGKAGLLCMTARPSPTASRERRQDAARGWLFILAYANILSSHTRTSTPGPCRPIIGRNLCPSNASLWPSPASWCC